MRETKSFYSEIKKLGVSYLRYFFLLSRLRKKNVTVIGLEPSNRNWFDKSRIVTSGF